MVDINSRKFPIPYAMTPPDLAAMGQYDAAVRWQDAMRDKTLRSFYGKDLMRPGNLYQKQGLARINAEQGAIPNDISSWTGARGMDISPEMLAGISKDIEPDWNLTKMASMMRADQIRQDALATAGLAENSNAVNLAGQYAGAATGRVQNQNQYLADLFRSEFEVWQALEQKRREEEANSRGLAGTVLGGVGAVIGGIYGGPGGATAGWALGNTAGSYGYDAFS